MSTNIQKKILGMITNTKSIYNKIEEQTAYRKYWINYKKID